MSKYSKFIFEDYIFDPKNNSAEFIYSFDGEVFFSEKIAWNIEQSDYNPKILDQALFALWIMAGISYFKAYLPREIILKKGELTKGQKEFFTKTYELGLAQFFYTNKLEWKNSINFAYSEIENETKLATGNNGSFSAIGGGKDSIVAAEILKKMNIDFECWAINQAERFESISDVVGLRTVSVTRQIDPKLYELNSLDAYNGHVPITAINSFVGVVLAILSGRKSLVWAIESSADEPNTEWKGLSVNHQYSKSLEFENDIITYINKFIATDLEYYSILRPLSELRIAEIFCKNYFNSYRGKFSSCNANFTFGNKEDLKWCGKCPKCVFVFILFSPFLAKKDLLELFGGNDIYADPKLQGSIRELLGIDGHKPLECVGEIAEVRHAVQMAKDGGEYPAANNFEFERPNYDYKKWSTNNIPEPTHSKLKSLLENT